MILEEKIEVLESLGCVRITQETLDQIEKENKNLYNSVKRAICRGKEKGRRYILIYINNRRFMIYSKEYIEKYDVNKIKKKLKLWVSLFKGKS